LGTFCGQDKKPSLLGNYIKKKKMLFWQVEGKWVVFNFLSHICAVMVGYPFGTKNGVKIDFFLFLR